MERQLYLITVTAEGEADRFWSKLEDLGWQPLYYVEEVEGSRKIGAYAPLGAIDFASIEAIGFAEVDQNSSIDWDAQWSKHSPSKSDGGYRLDLSPWGEASPPCLLAGGGFGDFSHPTTRLTWRLIARDLSGRLVIDLGCGSGILSVAAAKLGASGVVAIDCDSDALAHTAANVKINGLDQSIVILDARLGWPEKFQLVERPLIAMNMIATEQRLAKEFLPPEIAAAAEWVTSGVLVEQKRDYLKQCFEWGWKLQEEVEEEGWLAFRLTSAQSH